MKDWDVTLLVLLVAFVVIAVIVGTQRECARSGGVMTPDGTCVPVGPEGAR